MTVFLNHPAIKAYEQTSFACPEAYAGTLATGERFAFRLRYGNASLRLGHGDDAPSAAMSVGDNLLGIFEDSEQRDRVFATLYRRVAALRVVQSADELADLHYGEVLR